MRLNDSAHLAHPWRIHALTPDFALEDVWALDTPGGPDDFPQLVELVAAGDPAERSSKVVGVLFALRWKLGELLGWDDERDGLGARVPTLRERLPEDLRDGPAGPAHRRAAVQAALPDPRRVRRRDRQPRRCTA